MMYSLIIDAGSTKMDWVMLGEKKVVNRFSTAGFNPNYADPQRLKEILSQTGLATKVVEDVYRIHYYGSGCMRTENAMMVKRALKEFFPNSLPEVGDDMMGACHALLGHQKGIACILGTGANSCLYDGEAITDRAVSLGYLVGDEGSGCYIGRKVARAYFYGLMPDDLKAHFKQECQLELGDFIDKVYHQPEPSKFLASFTRFAGDHIDHPFVKGLVKECFNDFITSFVLRYKDCREMPVCFVGSVGFYFQTLLYECLSAEGLTMGKVMRSPMEGLIQMYS